MRNLSHLQRAGTVCLPFGGAMLPYWGTYLRRWGHRRTPRRVSSIVLVWVLTTAATASPTAADSNTQDTVAKPAEETRLPTGVFRAGLKKRGLTELLELHVRDFPSASPTETQLMMRDVRLAEHGDPTLPLGQRREAIAEANRILEKVIQQNHDDPRRFEWRFALAHSRLYDQGEPFFTSILYRGGSAADRARLLGVSTSAVAVLKTLLEELSTEYQRVDGLSIGEFERLEASGYVEQLDRLAPRAEYLLLWALFYDSLPRDQAGPVRAAQLNDILERFSANAALLETPHAMSHIQVQALLLSGMTCRRLNRHKNARQLLDRSVAVTEQLADADERDRIDWAVTLTRLESVRNDRDEGRFDEALRRLERFRDRVRSTRGDPFGLKVVSALLERSIYRHRALSAERMDRPTEARQDRLRAWRALERLAQQEPRRRDEIYATIYELIGPDADPEALDPFEQCALIAGLLFDESQPDSDSSTLLDRAVGVGERFLASARPATESLVAEVVYNVAVAEYRRGRPEAAARRFLEVARDHPTFKSAAPAGGLAAQLAAKLRDDPRAGTDPNVQDLYREALDVLVTRHPGTEEGRYWRFHYAQWLDEQGKYESAADQYARVDEAHEHHVESMFLKARCLALAMQHPPDGEPEDPLVFQARLNDFFAGQRDFLTRVSDELGRQGDAERRAMLKSLQARARVLAAEVQMLPQVGRAAQALETLAGFEDAYPGEPALTGRVWRVRLLAYESLGRLDQATSAIPAYIEADPDHAGQTLQSLYLSLAAATERLRDQGDMVSALRKAEVALILADQTYAWAFRAAHTSDDERRALTLQLAEANLRAQRFERARELFESLLPGADAVPSAQRPDDPRIVYGHAESLFRLAEHAAALPAFNRLATGLPPNDPMRWKALLRDLQCRTELGEPPEGIIQVIRQQRFLYPDLGGRVLAPQFDRLQRENERRTDKG